MKNNVFELKNKEPKNIAKGIKDNIQLIDCDLQEFIDRYIQAIKLRLRSHKQIQRHLMRFEKYFPGRKIASIKRRDIAEYIEYRQNQGIDSTTINIELSIFSASINFMNRRWEIELDNPVKGMHSPTKPGRVRYLERNEVILLLQAANTSRRAGLYDFIHLALNTGARKNELLQLQFKNLDFEHRILTIEGYTTKTGRRRYLPINRMAQEALLRRKEHRDKECPESPWVFSKSDGNRLKYLDKQFRQAVKEAGLIDFHIHDLRHTFASWLVSEGVELIKVRDLLGHTSIRMTERYAHLAPYRLHEAVPVLDRYM